ncbi:hypothetical protein [Pseudoalteromonas piscicida]|uniref:DUF541 domain-containing protein n=1 Tax=Pseudoalteromonas piscicida TaxID=43662 RepID=A0A2A5JTW4_PSEO7|nr:hypothetical protein [Pseudoalteromonas piscicida]PCK32903.1 hypothetical protein CEX98_04755 [Pseudoalteromonas piscicida]
MKFKMLLAASALFSSSFVNAAETATIGEAEILDIHQIYYSNPTLVEISSLNMRSTTKADLTRLTASIDSVKSDLQAQYGLSRTELESILTDGVLHLEQTNWSSEHFERREDAPEVERITVNCIDACERALREGSFGDWADTAAAHAGVQYGSSFNVSYGDGGVHQYYRTTPMFRAIEHLALRPVRKVIYEGLVRQPGNKDNDI